MVYTYTAIWCCTIFIPYLVLYVVATFVRMRVLLFVACLVILFQLSPAWRTTNFQKILRPRSRRTSAMRMMKLATLDQFTSKISLLLGSGSSSRKKILERNGFSFEVIKAGIDEKALGDRSAGADPMVLVGLLAQAKADAIMERLDITKVKDDSVLLTADQVVVHNGNIMEKPKDISQAREFINMYNNHQCSTVGSIVLTHIKSKRRVYGVDTSTIFFKTIPNDVIEKILDEGEVIHCAGGLMVEHPLLQPYLDRIEGTEDSVMGLSTSLLAFLLSDLFSDNNNPT